MSHSVDVAQSHETRAEEEETAATTVAHIPPGEGRRALWVLGELLTYKVPSYGTSGTYALFEVTTPPGAGPPPHIQHREDESFYVLEGDYEFLIEGRTTRVGLGSLLHVPKGTLHAHKNMGEEVGSMLVIQTPGGLYERFFEEVGTPSDGGRGPLAEDARPNSEAIAAVGAEYGIEIPLPVAQRGRV